MVAISKNFGPLNNRFSKSNFNLLELDWAKELLINVMALGLWVVVGIKPHVLD